MLPITVPTYDQVAPETKVIFDQFVLINVMSFTNFVYRLTRIPIDFPLAKPI